MIVEALKKRISNGDSYERYFWRDSLGNEIDLLVESPQDMTAVEAKSGAISQPEWANGIRTWWRHTAGAPRNQPAIISGGEASFWFEDGVVLGWRDAFGSSAE